MKKIFLFLAISFSLQAQSDSLKVTFSEEKVEKFEKTTLIDEYEKAFGGNRVVKSGLRMRFINNPINGGFDVNQFQFEHRFKEKLSLTLKLGAQSSKNAPVGIELRKYKDKSENTTKLANLNGDFTSIFIENSLHNQVPKFSSGYFYGLGAIGISKGKQFGNILSFGFKGGLRFGQKSFVDGDKNWVFPMKSNINFTPFLSSFTEIGIGLFFPLKKKTPSNYCEFLNCHYEIKKMWRVNFSNLIYIDKYESNIAIDIANERKIGNTPFSINSGIITSINYHNEYLATESRDTLIKNGFSTIPLKTKIYKFENSTLKLWKTQLAINEQIRYYPGLKRRIKNNKSSNNLNGTYLGIFGEVNFISRYFNKTSAKQIRGFDKLDIVKSFGIMGGYQTLVSKKAFLSYELFGGLNQYSDYSNGQPIDPILLVPIRNQLQIDARIKLGLAK